MADETAQAEDVGTDGAQSVKDAAGSAKDAADGATGTLREQVGGAFADAARSVIVPAIGQMPQQAAEQAATYAKEQGPRLVKEQVRQVMKAVGADKPEDLAKAGIGKAGDMISGAGGLAGLAGKVMSKFGGKGKGGGQATGYGKGRRMPVQQDVMVSLPVREAYTAWTEYSRWPEYMNRVNGSDPQLPDEAGEEARIKVTEKLWGFTRPFTAQITEQRPDEIIRWKTVEGVSHIGRIGFHELAPSLTLISVNLDHAPSGMFEKIGRGARFSKRAVRADLHRFKGWAETREADELEDMEGWRGTVENGEVTVTHQEALEEAGEEQDEEQEVEETEEEQPEAEEAEEVEETEEEEQPEPEETEEPEEPEAGLFEATEEESEEEPEDEEVEEEPEPEPKPRRRRTSKRAPRKPRAKTKR